MKRYISLSITALTLMVQGIKVNKEKMKKARPQSRRMPLNSTLVMIGLVSSATSALAQEKTPTGFYYPSGNSQLARTGGNFESTQADSPPYFDGIVHLGQDIMDPQGSTAIAVSDGLVVFAQSSSDPDQSRIWIEHRAIDPSTGMTFPFYAVYAHIRPLVTLGATVRGGENIGIVMDYAPFESVRGDHIHFGISRLGWFADKKFVSSPYRTDANSMSTFRMEVGFGRGVGIPGNWYKNKIENKQRLDTRGLEDPYIFIKRFSPAFLQTLVAPGANPQSATLIDGRIYVLWRGPKNDILESHQREPNSGFTQPVSLGGSVAGDPIIGRNRDGRLELFVRGTDNAIYSRWQESPGGPWSSGGGTANSGWQKFDIPGGASGNPAVSSNEDGRLQLYAVSSNGRLYSDWQRSIGGNWHGPIFFEGTELWVGPSACSDQFGHQLIGVRGGDRSIYSRYQSQLNGSWDPFQIQQSFVESRPVFSPVYYDSIGMFVLGTDGNIYWKTLMPSKMVWSNWKEFSRPGPKFISEPSAVVNMFGLKQVFAIDSNGTLQTANEWSQSWENLGSNLKGIPSAIRELDNRLHVFGVSSSGVLVQAWQKIENNHVIWSSVSKFP